MVRNCLIQFHSLPTYQELNRTDLGDKIKKMATDMIESKSYIEPKILTLENLALVGHWGVRRYAPEPVEAGSIRRFAQAIMDPDPLYWDQDHARTTRFGEVVAPPLYPLHAIRRAHTAPDPLERAYHDSEFDGFGELTTTFGLQPLNLPLRRLLNGGNDQFISSLARTGDSISALSCYEKLYEEPGKDGPLVFVVIFSRYEAESIGSR